MAVLDSIEVILTTTCAEAESLLAATLARFHGA